MTAARADIAIADELEALERRGWKALSGPDGARFYADLMADDGLMVFPGLVLDKQGTLRAMAAERPWSMFELTDIHVLDGGPGCGIVIYRATSARSGEAMYRALMSTVYVKRDGRWRLLLHQQSAIPREEPRSADGPASADKPDLGDEGALGR